MATIVTRAGKGSPLTNTEVDSNFSNLNTDKAELSGSTFSGAVEITNVDGLVAPRVYVGEGKSSGTRIQLSRSGTTNKLFSFTSSTSATPLDIVVGATTNALSIDASANVSIPNGNLDVTGSVVADKANIGTSTAQYSGTDLTVGDNADSQNGLAIQTSTSGVGYILFGDGSGASAYRGEINYSHSTDSLTLKTAGTNRLNLASNGDISFYNDSANQGLFFDSSTSRLGLGTTAPLSALNVKGTQGQWRVDPDSVSNHVEILSTNTANTGFLNLRLRANDFIVQTGGTDRLTLNSSGNASFSGAVTAETGLNLETGTLVIKNGTGDSSGLRIFQDSSDVSKIYNNFNGKLELGVGNTTAISIDSSENVNIPNGGLMVGATTAPEGQLTLQNDDASLRIRSNTTTTKGLTLKYNHAGNFGQLLVDHQGNNQLDMKYYALSHTFGRSDSLQFMTIDSSGNATFSGAVLDVENSSGAMMMVDDTNGRFIKIRSANSGSQNANISSYSGLYLGGSDNASHVVIDNQGRVNIGSSLMVGSTTAPSYKTHIKNTASWSLAYNNYSNDLFVENTSSGAGVGNFGGSIGFSGAGTESTNKRVVIASVQTGSDQDQCGLAFFTHPSQYGSHDMEEALRISHDKNATFSGSVTAGANGLFKNTANANGTTLTVADNADRAITITSPIAQSSAAGRIAVTGTVNSLEIGVRDYSTALTIAGSSGNVNIGSSLMVGATTPYRDLLVGFTSTDTNTLSTASGLGNNSNVGNGLMINNTSTADNTYAPLDFKCGTNNVWGRIAYKATNMNDEFGQFEFITVDDGQYINALTVGSSGNVTTAGSLTPAGGVQLGGTGSANKLDDYEEGTWTPALVAYAGTNPTVSSTSSGFYTKIGNLVTVSLNFDSLSVSGVTSGIMKISGLPFAPNGDAGGAYTANQITLQRPDTSSLMVLADGFGILSQNNGGNWAWELVSIFDGGSGVRATVSYKTNS